ncbi:MAG: DivIVA domain-containing protein [Bacilli bacterium]|nr:DivIVA domain-containing protein [Bacilli bacterium]
MKKFSYEEKGYNRKEVNAFIDEVIANSEELINRCKSQAEEIKGLTEELERLKNTDSKDIENSSKIRASALRDAEEIIASAKMNASMILNDSLLRASELNDRANLYERKIKLFKKKFKVLIDEYELISKEIEEIEFDKE